MRYYARCCSQIPERVRKAAPLGYPAGVDSSPGDSCSRSDTPASASWAPKKESRTDSREPEPLSSVLALLSGMDLGVCRYRDDL